jgi:transcriptional regulator with XRE-family HTH domain
MAKKQSGKNPLAGQILREMNKRKVTKQELAKRLKTSRSQVERILAPDNSVSLKSLEQVAQALGCRITMQLAKA